MQLQPLGDMSPTRALLSASEAFLPERRSGTAIPIFLAGESSPTVPQLIEPQRRWLETVRFMGAAKKVELVPAGDGRLGAVVMGLGDGAAGEPCGPSELLVGSLAHSLPPGNYRLAGGSTDVALAATAWGLGAYRFRRYRPGNDAVRRLELPDGVDRAAIVNTVEAVWLGRDLINTPASDMGPEELEMAARDLARRHDANVGVIAGDDLLTSNFPMIHAVGRASPRAPRLIDLNWGSQNHPRVTLIGKGICFDTGGLDIKPASGMLIMKKDMGGAAAVLSLAHMIMGRKLPIRLRVLIPAAENSIAGNAFRPGDVLRSRAGHTVEIGNTDAEGRLVLADAIALADEEETSCMAVFATLTGAARVALGPDLPALFTTDDALADRLVRNGQSIGDPVWRMPFWPGYERHLESDVADMNNVWDAPFAGAITAALFLKRYVKRARRFAHLDIYGWRSAARALGPKGGEPQGARALFATLQEEFQV